MNRIIIIALTIFSMGLLPGCGIKLVPRYPENLDGETSRTAWDSPASTPESSSSPQQSAISGTGKRLNKTMYNAFIAEIKRFMGAPYVWGGASPSGTDCSGLIATMYKRAADIDLPHSTTQLSKTGTSVSVRDLKFGDLLFFNDGQGKKPLHVGFYLAKGKFVHASVSSGVTVSILTQSPYKQQYLGAKRILE